MYDYIEEILFAYLMFLLALGLQNIPITQFTVLLCILQKSYIHAQYPQNKHKFAIFTTENNYKCNDEQYDSGVSDS